MSYSDERLEPAFGVRRRSSDRDRVVDVLHMGVDDGADELVLGLEVVVDVAQRARRRVGDVGERRLLDALLVDQASRPATSRSRFPGLGARAPATATV